MRRARFMFSLTLFVGALLTFAPGAMADEASGGQGWFGETTDKSVTNVMFLTIILFPVLITIFSLIQWRLDKRKHARMDAEKARSANVDWRGGW
jgi:fatty acid desaturase